MTRPAARSISFPMRASRSHQWFAAIIQPTRKRSPANSRNKASAIIRRARRESLGVVRPAYSRIDGFSDIFPCYRHRPRARAEGLVAAVR